MNDVDWWVWLIVALVVVAIVAAIAAAMSRAGKERRREQQREKAIGLREEAKETAVDAQRTPGGRGCRDRPTPTRQGWKPNGSRRKQHAPTRRRRKGCAKPTASTPT